MTIPASSLLNNFLLIIYAIDTIFIYNRILGMLLAYNYQLYAIVDLRSTDAVIPRFLKGVLLHLVYCDLTTATDESPIAHQSVLPEYQ